MKKQPRSLSSFRGRLGLRARPLVSQTGAALLISLGLLQSAAAGPVVAGVGIDQDNSSSITGSITDTSGNALPFGAQFSAPLATGASVTLSGNGATSNATGNISLPSSSFSLEVNGQPLLDAGAALNQANSGAVSSTLAPGSALIVGVGASGATAAVTQNTFEANASANKGVTSIGIDPAGALTLNQVGVSLQSSQTHLSANVSATSQSTAGVTLDGDSQGNVATVTGNAARSSALDNNASNSIAIRGASVLDATNILADDAVSLFNLQEVRTDGGFANVTASTVNQTGVFAAAGSNVSGGVFTVSGNQASASAQRNLASNVIGIAEGRFEGLDPVITPLFSLGSLQVDSTVGSTVSATTAADINIDSTVMGAAQQLQATLSGNNISALASDNSASNKVSLGTAGAAGVAVPLMGALTDVGGLVNNVQTGASIVTAGSTGISRIQAGILTGTLNVTGNRVQASAFGNQSDNVFQASASSADGLDVALQNRQTYLGTDFMGAVLSQATGGFGVVAVNAPASTPPTSVTVSGNTVASQASVNSASNLSSLSTTTSLDFSQMALSNTQSSTAAANSTTTVKGIGAAGILNDLSSRQVTVSGNAATAQAMQNVAANALVLSAGALDGGLVAAPARVNTAGVTADYGVYSQQTASAATNATVNTDGNVGVGIFAENALPANMTVINNVLSATARANVANNQLQATSTTSVGNASFGLANVQTSLGATQAKITSTAVGVVNNNPVTPAPLVTVSGNALNAAASGNAAANALSVAAGTSLTADTSLAAPTFPLGAAAGYALLNSQSNSGAINASVDLPVVGMNANGPAQGQIAAVTGNALNATAYGNHAVNTVALSALPGQLSASSALVSNQVNGGNVSASIGSALIGSTVSSLSGITTVAHNQVTASAVGNMAVSSMRVGSN